MPDISLEARVERVRASSLLPILDLFLAERDRRNLDPRTVENYRHQIQPFRTWWEERDGPPVLTEEALAEFNTWLTVDWVTATGSAPAPSTIHTTARRVRQFLRWLHKTGRMAADISDWMPMPPAVDSPQRFISPDDLQAVLDAIPPGPLRFRDWATVALLAETGARRFEVAEILADCVHVEADMSGGWVDLYKVKGDAKGRRGKSRRVAFGPATAVALHFYRLHQGLVGVGWDDDPRLLQMSNTAIRLRVAKWSTLADLPLGAHDFRRTFADHWLENCPDRANAMILLKLQLGHALKDDITVAHYIDTRNREKIARKLRENYVSPLDGLDLPWGSAGARELNP